MNKLYLKKTRASFFTPNYYPPSIMKQFTKISDKQKRNWEEDPPPKKLKPLTDNANKDIWLVSDWYNIYSKEL